MKLSRRCQIYFFDASIKYYCRDMIIYGLSKQVKPFNG